MCLIASGHEAGGSCRKQADVLFLIETTSNVTFDYFQRYILGFVSDVIQQLDVDTGRTQVSIVSYSDNAQVRQISGSHDSLFQVNDNNAGVLQESVTATISK